MLKESPALSLLLLSRISTLHVRTIYVASFLSCVTAYLRRFRAGVVVYLGFVVVVVLVLAFSCGFVSVGGSFRPTFAGNRASPRASSV